MALYTHSDQSMMVISSLGVLFVYFSTVQDI